MTASEQFFHSARQDRSAQAVRARPPRIRVTRSRAAWQCGIVTLFVLGTCQVDGMSLNAIAKSLGVDWGIPGPGMAAAVPHVFEHPMTESVILDADGQDVSKTVNPKSEGNDAGVGSSYQNLRAFSQHISEEEVGKVLNELRHYTEQTGCVEYEVNATEPVEVDPCYLNWKASGRVEGEYCSDSYFGGKAGCCYDEKSQNCSSCKRPQSCSVASLECALSYLETCGANSTGFDFSSTFALRKSSCQNGMVTNYWRHPGYYFKGDFQYLSSVGGIRTPDGCADSCGMTEGCNSFAYETKERLCLLHQYESYSLCDGSTEPDCAHDGREWFVLDEDDIYCAENSAECACTREYFECMVGYGCEGNEEEICAFGDMCTEKGCSSKQCGIGYVNSTGFLSTCANEYFTCLIEQNRSCSCTQDYVVCMALDPDFDPRTRDRNSGMSIIEMCNKEGCSAEDCGLPADFCNSTSLNCGHEYMSCVGGAFGDAAWDEAEEPGSSLDFAARVVKFYDAGLTVSWPVMPVGVYGGVRTTFGVDHGKVYWEVQVSGICAVVGVGTEDHGPFSHPGVDERSWAFGDLGLGGRLMNGKFTPAGPAISAPAVIGVALDASAGKVWFSVNGVWVNGGNPATGLNPSFVLGVPFGTSLFPIAGTRCPVATQKLVNATARFSDSLLSYPFPEGFNAFESSECTCSVNFRRCMVLGNCGGHGLMHEIYQSCIASGCSVSECGTEVIPPRGVECDGLVPLTCNQEFLQCASVRDQCECTREMFECMAVEGCQMKPTTLEQYGELCATHGCSAEQCGLCAPTCNSTAIACRDAYDVCEETQEVQVGNETITISTNCSCDAAYYHCMHDGGCVSDEVSVEHALLCLEHKCTAAECGLEQKFQQCNVTNLICSERFFACQDKRLPFEEDRCSTNYKPNGGEDFCFNPVFGGIAGCQYDPKDDSCYTSGDCLCSHDYVDCMKGACMNSESAFAFAETCVLKGCTASQCGLDGYFCNQTSLICANSYLQCQLTDLDQQVFAMLGDAEEEEELPWCAASFCLRNYFDCMNTAKCTSEEDLAEHLLICELAGCTPQQCGVDLIDEPSQPPDAPEGVNLISVINERMNTTWMHSALAYRWARQGSKNSILQYFVVLEGACVRVTGDIFDCPKFLYNRTLAFSAPRNVQFGGGLVIGNRYRASVFAINTNSTGPPGSDTSRLSGPPKEPQNVRSQRIGARSAAVSWALPLDTGDTTQDVPLDGYEVEVTASSSAIPVVLPVDQDTTSLVFQSSVGGNYTKCADHDAMCLCYGLVRFGSVGAWSPPIATRGSVKCAPSANIPDILPGNTEICQCNPEGQALTAGQNLSARVLAINYVGKGDYSTPTVVKIMGEPSAVRNLKATEFATFATVEFETPADSGFGVLDKTAPILSYDLYISTCQTFNTLDSSCGVRQILLPASGLCTAGRCTYTLQEANTLEEGAVYFLRAVARNPVGTGFLSFAPLIRLPWKVFPSITFPSASVFPIRAVEWQGVSTFWYNGVPTPTVTVKVTDFPYLQSGVTYFFNFRKNGITAPVQLKVLSRQIVTPSANLTDLLGIDVETTFEVRAPLFGNGPGDVTGRIFVAAYPTKSFDLSFQYFEYPSPTVTLMTPSAGPLGGGNKVRVEISEPSGPETRQGAGITNFLDAPLSGIGIVFNGTLTATVLSKDLLGLSVSIIFRAPASRNAADEIVPVTFKLAGAFIAMSAPVPYKYRGAFIDSVVPRNGLTTGGMRFTVIVRDLGLINLNTIQNLAVTFQLQGDQEIVQPIDLSASSVESAEQTILVATTYGSPNAPGPVDVRVTFDRPGASSIALFAPALFTYILPPPMEIVTSSIKVPSRSAGQVWVATTASSTEVTFDIKYLYVQAGQTLTVQFYVPYTTTAGANTFTGTVNSFRSTGDANDARFAQTTVSVNAPATDPRTGFGHILVILKTGSTENARAVTGDTSTQGPLEFRNIRVPLVVAAAPSEGSPIGGSIVMVGVTGFGTSGSFSARFDSQSSDTPSLGAISVADWAAEDQAYETIRSSAGLDVFFSTLGSGTQSALNNVVDRTTTQIAADVSLTTANSFLVFFLVPAKSGVIAPTDETVTVKRSTRSSSFTFRYIPDPTTPAVLQSLVPASGSQSLIQSITLTITNFAVVVYPSDVTVTFGSRTVSAIVVSSTSENTQLAFLTSVQSIPGLRTITAFPTRNTDNRVTAQYEYLDNRPPEVESLVPDSVYAEGGSTVKAVLTNFGDASIVAAQITISLLSNGVTTTTPALTVLYDSFKEEAALTFVTKVGIAGETLVTFAYRKDASSPVKSVVTSLTYLAVPSGPAPMTLNPTTGFTSGGQSILAQITNFKKVNGAADLVVMFGSARIASASLSVQSTTQSTLVSFVTPSRASGGTVSVQIYATGRQSNIGTASYIYIDNNQAQLIYRTPTAGNAADSTVVQVGIRNLGVVVSSTDAFLVSPSQVTVSQISDSTAQATNLLLNVPSSLIVVGSILSQQTSITITIQLSGSAGTLKTVSFQFTYFPAGALWVDFSSPRRAYTDGGLAMEVQLENLPKTVEMGQVQIVFGEGGPVANATYLQIDASTGDVATATVRAIVPATEDARVITPFVRVLGLGLTAPFQDVFTYQDPPFPVIQEIFPSRGDINSLTTVSVTLDFFPAVSRLTDIVILINGAEAEVTSFTRINPALDPMDVQGIRANIRAPCCANDILPGVVATAAYHRFYEFRSVFKAGSFTYFSSLLPNVVSVIGDFNENRVKTSEQTLVTVVIQAVPLQVNGVEDVAITMNSGATVLPALSLAITSEGVATIRFLAPTSNTQGAKQVQMQFLATSAYTTTFEIVYYDVATPVITQLAPSSGNYLGGTQVLVSLANFPAISSTNDVTARFGTTGAYFGDVKQVSTNNGVTVIVLLTPAYDVGSAGSALVPLQITPVAQVNLASSTQNFQFIKPEVVLASFSPTRGVYVGGTVINAIINNFPEGSTPGTVKVKFGNTLVAASNITVPLSTRTSTQLRIIAPPGAISTASVQVKIWDSASGEASAQLASFQYFDDKAIQTVEPLPQRACYNTNGQTTTVFVKFPPVDAVLSDYTFSFNAAGAAACSDCGVTAPSQATDLGNRLVMITVPVPNVAVIGTRTLLFEFRGSEVDSIPFEFYNCNEPFVSLVSPTKGIYTGGNVINVRVTNFPAASGSYSVLFGESTSGTVRDAVVDSSNTAAIQIVSPAMNTLGVVTVTLTGTFSVTFSFEVVSPPDFYACCGTFSKTPDLRVIRSSPPMDNTCLAKYCIDESAVTFPSLVSVSPTTGPTQGSTTVVTLLMDGFPALSLNDVTVSVGTSTTFANPVSLDADGGDVLTAVSTLTFQMPNSPVGASKTSVVVTGKFNDDVARSLTFFFEYYAPISGNPVLLLNRPTTIRRGLSEETIFFQLANFPLIEDISQSSLISYTTSLSSTPRTASLILASSRASTDAQIQLTGLNLASQSQLTINVYYSRHPSSRAAAITLTVIDDPDPVVKSAFPEQGLMGQTHTISMVIGNMFNGGSISASSLTASVNGDSSLASISTSPLPVFVSSCTGYYCSPISVSVIVSSAVSTAGELPVTVCSSSGARCATMQFLFIAPDAPYVDQVVPSTGLSTGATSVQVFIRNFGTIAFTSDLVLSIGGVGADAISFEQRGEVLVVDATIPARNNPGVVEGQVYKTSTGQELAAVWSFEYLQPPSKISPIDMPTSSTSTEVQLVTIEAFWGGGADGIITDIANLAVEFGGQAGTVRSIVSSNFVTTVVQVEVPSSMPAGIVVGSLSAKDTYETTFTFEFFDPPFFSDVQPRLAATDGSVDDCPSCSLRNDGKTLTLNIEEFPAISSIEDVEVTFRTATVTTVCDGTACSLGPFRNLAGGLLLTVTVPPFQEEGLDLSARIIVSYEGDPLPPPGGSTSQTFTRMPRVASTNLFSYVKPSPSIALVQYCQECASATRCVVAGQCANGVLPVVGVTTGISDLISIYLPDSGGGVLIVTVEDLNVDDNADFDLSVAIGGIAATLLRSERVTSGGRTVVEVVPAQSSSLGEQNSVVSFVANGLTRSAEFSSVIYDATLVMRCHSGCAGRADGGIVANVSVTNFPIVSSAENVVVTFAGRATLNVVIDYSDAQVTFFRVTSPACLSCNFQDGAADVSFRIESAGSSQTGAEVGYVYYSAPEIVDVLFTTTGTGLRITFDQPTNKASGVCVSSAQSLGSNPSHQCAWANDRTLAVQLGSGALITPSDTVTLTGGTNLFSANGLSPPAGTQTAAVFPPSVLSEPGPVTIKYPAEVDQCSPLVIKATVPSARSLTYTWRCLNNENFDTYLRAQQSDTISLGATTPEMDTLDFTYQVTLTVSNFLGGALRTPRAISIRKKGNPGPSIQIFVRASYKRSETILVKGEAEFSSCSIEKAQMTFKWTKISGANDLVLPTTSTNQLYFLPHALSAGTYTLTLTATSSTDASKTTSKTFDLVVISAPDIVAVIDGGRQVGISADSELFLSADQSRDLMESPNRAQQGLSFSWSCAITVGGVSSSCRDAKTGSLIALPNTAGFTLASGSLAASSVAPYVFTVTVSKNKARGSASIEVSVSALPIPYVQITHQITQFTVEGIPRVNPEYRFQLFGSSDQKKTEFSWEIGNGLDLDSISPVPLGARGKILQLVPAKCTVCPLFTNGVEYTITLTGTAPNGLVGTADLIVLVNEAPVGSCSACVEGTGGSTGIACRTRGAALVDRFVMSCINWIDEDTPLLYRFGFQTSNGRIHYTDPVPDDSKAFVLGSDAKALWAYVTDSAGAISEHKTSSITVTPISRRRASGWDLVAVAIGNLQDQTLLGKAGEVNLLGASIASEIDVFSPGAALAISQVYKAEILAEVSAVRASVAETPGLAQETALAVHFISSKACDLSADSVVTVTTLVLWTATVLKDGATVADESSHQNVVSILSHATEAQNGAVCTSLGAASLTGAQVTSWMATVTSVAFLIMTNSVLAHAVGEPPVVISANYYSLSATKTDTTTISGYELTVGTTKFTLPNSSALFPGATAGTIYDVIQNNQDLIDGAETFFLADFIASVMGGLTLSLGGSSTAESISLTSNDAIMIEIPINPTVAENYGGVFWRQKINCNFYDTTTGKMSYTGCIKTNLVETSATAATLYCNCTHLTDFSAGVDPNIPVCGDGIISPDTEFCDDGNIVGTPADGCSEICTIQTAQGWDCAGSTISICCGPCSPGQFRQGCTNLNSLIPEADRVDGVCADCAAGKAKAVVGTYQSVCTDCPSGTFALGGAINCSNHQPCGPGTYRVGATTASTGTCQPCPAGTYKDTDGTWETQCTAFSACSPGFELLDETASFAGTCTACPLSTWLTAGEYHEACVACPPNAITSAEGASVRTQCLCDEIAYTTIGGADATYCQDIDECTDIRISRSPCMSNAACTNSEGSFSCACNTGYEAVAGIAVSTFPFACRPVCGDGFVYPCDGAGDCNDATRCDDGAKRDGDGCSSSCSVEANWVCSGGSTTSRSTCSCAASYYPEGSCNTLCTSDLTLAAADPTGCATGYCGSTGGACDSTGYCVCQRYWFGCQCATQGIPFLPIDITVSASGDTLQEVTYNGQSLGSLLIPAGAIAAGTSLTLDVYEQTLLTTVPGYDKPSSATLLAYIFDLGPEGTTFSSDVTLSIKADAYPQYGQSFFNFYFNRDTMAWDTLMDSTWDNATQLISVPLSHFSTYTAMSIPTPTTTTPAPTTSSSTTPAPTTTTTTTEAAEVATTAEPPVPEPTDPPIPEPTNPPVPEPTTPDTTPAPPTSTTTTTPEPGGGGGGGGSPIAAIVGGVVGGLVVLAIIAYILWRRRQAQLPIAPHHGDAGVSEPLLATQGSRTGVQEFSQPSQPIDGRPETADLPRRPVGESPEPGAAGAPAGQEVGQPIELGTLGQQEAPFAPSYGDTEQSAGANFGWAHAERGQRNILSEGAPEVVVGLADGMHYNPFSPDPEEQEDSITTWQSMGHNFGRAPSDSDVPDVAEAMSAMELEDRPPARVPVAWGAPDDDEEVPDSRN